ncbi:uncharacterized protein LOC144743095 [Ciona intestinalis]
MDVKMCVLFVVLQLVWLIRGNEVVEDIRCNYAPGISLGSREHELDCCESVDEMYNEMWYTGGYYITRYLSIMKDWNCTQYTQVCQDKVFAVTRFSELVYDSFCNHTLLEEKCTDVVVGVANIVSNQTNWTTVVETLDSSKLTLQQLKQPCVGIALFEQEGFHFGDFQEVIAVNVPFCGFAWCGFNQAAINRFPVSSWTCVTERCQTNTVLTTVVISVVSFLIVLLNATVIFVLVTNQSLRKSQYTYKMSLAFADLLVGIFVLPTILSSVLKLLTHQIMPGELYNVTGVWEINKSVTMRDMVGSRTDAISQSYLNFVGFVTTISLMANVYSMLGAALDQLLSVFKPLWYLKHRAMRIAKWWCATLWIISVVYAILPIVVPGWKYSFDVSRLVLDDSDTNITYILFLFTPLVLMWVINIATYCITRRRLATMQRMNSTTSNLTNMDRQSRLFKTIAIIITVFTLSLLPMVLAVILVSFIPYVSVDDPQNLVVESAVAFFSAEYVALIVLLSSSLWNFWIYHRRNQNFRNAITSLMSGVTSRGSE